MKKLLTLFLISGSFSISSLSAMHNSNPYQEMLNYIDRVRNEICAECAEFNDIDNPTKRLLFQLISLIDPNSISIDDIEFTEEEVKRYLETKANFYKNKLASWAPFKLPDNQKIQEIINQMPRKFSEEQKQELLNQFIKEYLNSYRQTLREQYLKFKAEINGRRV